MTARSLILIHGGGSGPWVFGDWADAFPGMAVSAIDLHRGRDVGSSSMWDYQAAVIEAAELMPTPLALCGWSMGGLVAMMAAEKAGVDALVLLEPSPPAEVRGDDHDVPLERGTYDPEEEYGPFPSGMAPRPESALARAERQRGISIPKLPDRSLVICGWQFPEARGRNLAARYQAEIVEFPDLDHWQLLLDPRVPSAVNDFLQR